MTTPDTQAVTVALGSLAEGARFRVAGDGNRTGTLLRLTEVSALVVMDKRKDERREPIAVALTLKVHVVEAG